MNDIFFMSRAPTQENEESNILTLTVGTEPEEQELILDSNVDVPVASIGASSLFSNRFVMVVSTQLVFTMTNKRDNVLGAQRLRQY